MSKNRTYTLINPYLVKEHLTGGGDSELSTTEKTPMAAAENLWQQIAEHIKNHTPSFYFSVKDEKDGSVTHYKVEEHVADGNVQSVISEHKITGGDGTEQVSANDVKKINALLLTDFDAKTNRTSGGSSDVPYYGMGGKRSHRSIYNDFDSSSSDVSSTSSSDSISSDSEKEIVYAKGAMGYNIGLSPFGMPYKTNDLSLTGLVYYPNIYGVGNITIPSFMTDFTPYVNIKFLPLVNVTIPANVI